MPTYDYVCKACEHAFELFQSMTAPVKRKCPECGKLKLQRLVGTGAGVIFKGSGFYETDYRSDSYRKAQQEATKAEQGKTDGKAGAKSDKTDTKKSAGDAGSSSASGKKAGASSPKPAGGSGKG